jgi:purine nucleoside permease
VEEAYCIEKKYKSIMPMKKVSFLTLAAFWFACSAPREKGAEPIPVKVVVITMFEQGEDEGDKPGEFQYWVERLPLDSVIPFPQGYRDLRYNAERGILGICTGIGTARAAASIMALGMDPRFDLRKTYFLVAGIAGIDPEDGPTGSAAWAEWLVDGDLAHEIDSREMPADWPTGYLPLRKKKPYEQPVTNEPAGEVFRLDSLLVNWAYELTKDMPLADSPELQQARALYTEHPGAQRPPLVMKGDQLAAMTYWHGKLLNDWANEWVRYWTRGQGNFVTSAMEDTGTMQSLVFLEKAGKVDASRLLVLRTASNFTMQYPGITAVQSLNKEKAEGEVVYSAFIPALEAAWSVGYTVVEALEKDWSRYANKKPGR